MYNGNFDMSLEVVELTQSKNLMKKKSVTIRLDDDIIEWFKKHAKKNGYLGYQTYINTVLRSFISRGGGRKG